MAPFCIYRRSANPEKQLSHILVPIHIGEHWFLLLVDLHRRIIEVSMAFLSIFEGSKDAWTNLNHCVSVEIGLGLHEITQRGIGPDHLRHIGRSWRLRAAASGNGA